MQGTVITGRGKNPPGRGKPDFLNGNYIPESVMDDEDAHTAV